MHSSSYRSWFLKTALATAVLSASVAQAEDWNITGPAEVPYNDLRRIVVGQDIVSSSEDAVIAISSRQGGVKVETEKILSTSASAGVPSSPEKATIYVGSGGSVERTIENLGHIRNGIFITGKSTHQSGNAFWSKGQDATHKASVQGCYTVVNGGISEALNDHAVNIDSNSYMDFVVVGANSTIRSSGNGTSAIYVAKDGQLGGEFSSSANSRGITISRSETDDALNVSGNLIATNGRAIDIVGSATGRLFVNSSGVIQGGGANAQAVNVAGSYTGTFENMGEINTGIFISGTHIANNGAAYWARGTANDSAVLTGCYTTVDGGISRSTNQHAIYLDNYSKTDFVVAKGKNDSNGSLIESTASGKNAIYVAETAQLGGIGGRGENHHAIIAQDGGQIRATGDSAIEVDGKFIGMVYVNNGSITGDASSINSVDFSSANSPLKFLQVGDSSATTGAILASPGFKNDTVEFRAGSFDGATIQNVDKLIVDTRTSTFRMRGNFTLPTETTVSLSLQTLTDGEGNEYTGIDTGNPVITVDGNVDAEAEGSRITVKPASSREMSLIRSGTTITLVKAGIVEGTVKSRVKVESGSLLINATAQFSGDDIKATLSPNTKASLESSLRSKGASARGAKALAAALDVATATTSADSTRASKIFAVMNDTNNDHVKLAKEVQPKVTGGLQKANQSLANTSHNIVFNRIHGLRRGISYGDQFVDGAAWGQFLYTSGKQSKVDGEPGFKNQTWGLTLGADAELDPNVRMGLAFTLAKGSVDGDDGSTHSSYSYLTTLYGSWSQRGYFVDTMMTVGGGSNDSKKTVSGQSVKGDYDIDQWGFRLITGMAWRFGNWNMSPQAEFNYGLVRANEYTEKGSTGFEQKVDSSDFITAELGGGLKFNGEFWLRRGVLKPELTFMGYYNFNREGSKVKATYLAGGNSFTVTGPDRDPVRLSTGIGLGLQMTNRWTMRAGYDYNWTRNYTSDSFSARARYEF